MTVSDSSLCLEAALAAGVFRAIVWFALAVVRHYWFKPGLSDAIEPAFVGVHLRSSDTGRIRPTSDHLDPGTSSMGQ
jgi:hypothetical protein